MITTITWNVHKSLKHRGLHEWQEKIGVKEELSTSQKTWQKQLKNGLVKLLWDFTFQNCVNMKQRILMWTKTG